jgi:hypothetical protein
MLERSIDFSIVTARFTLNVISVNDPSGTVPIPHPFASNVGKNFCNSIAAPVVVGTID